MGAAGWEWDETLFAGSASHYGSGRMPYPQALAEAIGRELELDGTGRLLDVGCGPGSFTFLLAPLFETAVAVDADGDMIAAARRRAAEIGATGIDWRQLRAEDLPAGLGTFRAVTFAQSFHWMDQPLVAGRVRGMLDAGGAWLHVAATTHRGAPGEDALPFPRPPWDRIDDLIATYLGPVRRAGRGLLPDGTRAGEEEVMRQAGFAGPTRIELAAGQVVNRDCDEVVSAVFSMSGSAPHLFADRLPAFEAGLRQLLRAASLSGRFAERTQNATVVIWRP